MTKTLQQYLKETNEEFEERLKEYAEHILYQDARGHDVDKGVERTMLEFLKSCQLGLVELIRGFKGKCSFCNKETDCRSDGKGMWLCLPCARLQTKVWDKDSSQFLKNLELNEEKIK